MHQSLRANIDQIFIFPLVNQNRKRVFEQFAQSIFSSFEEFTNVHDDVTREPHTCLVIDQTRTAEKRPTFSWFRTTSQENTAHVLRMPTP
jgi:hypothetical protein